jgi:hypothetical protein
MELKIKAYDIKYDGYYFLFVKTNNIQLEKKLKGFKYITPKIIKGIDSSAIIKSHFTIDDINEIEYIDILYCYSDVDIYNRKPELIKSYQIGFDNLIKYNKTLFIYGSKDQFFNNYYIFSQLNKVKMEFIQLEGNSQ